MKLIKKAAPVILTSMILFTACNFNNAPKASDETPGYYARELELSTWIDEAETVWKPVENRVYNEAGRLTAVSKHTYEQMTEAGYEYYMNTRTDVYEVDKEGNHTFVEYYLYTYHPDYYEYVDDDGNEFVDVDYLLKRGETRTPMMFSGIIMTLFMISKLKTGILLHLTMITIRRLSIREIQTVLRLPSSMQLYS